MDKPLIKIFDPTITLLGVVADYEQMEFVPQIRSIGSFVFTVNMNTASAAYLVEDNIIAIDEKHSGIITSVVAKREIGTANEMLQVSGIQTKDILGFRRTDNGGASPVFTYTNQKPEHIVKDLIAKNIGASCTDTDRTYAVVAVATDSDRGTSIDFTTYHKNLLDEVFALLAPDGYGLKCTLDASAKTLTFDIVVGTDRTESQSTNDRVILGIEQGSLAGITRSTSTSGFCNYAFVGGQGEGADRHIEEVTSDAAATGIYRRETFVDARDIDDAGELASRGAQKLAEATRSEAIECVMQGAEKYVYNTDYVLGDYVTAVDAKLGISKTAQVTGARITMATQQPVIVSALLGYDTAAMEVALRRRLQATETTAVNGAVSTATVAGKVIAPATNTADYVPQWDGANSKLLKDGKGLSGADATIITGTKGANGNLVKWNADGDAVDAGIPSALKSTLQGSSLGTAIAAGQTRYIGIGLTTEAYSTAFVCPCAGTLKNLYVYTPGAPGTGNSIVFTLMDNNTATALTCSISGAASNTANDTANSVSTSAGHRLSLRAVSSAGAASLSVIFACEFDAS